MKAYLQIGNIQKTTRMVTKRNFFLVGEKSRRCSDSFAVDWDSHGVQKSLSGRTLKQEDTAARAQLTVRMQTARLPDI